MSLLVWRIESSWIVCGWWVGKRCQVVIYETETFINDSSNKVSIVMSRSPFPTPLIATTNIFIALHLFQSVITVHLFLVVSYKVSQDGCCVDEFLMSVLLYIHRSLELDVQECVNKTAFHRALNSHQVHFNQCTPTATAPQHSSAWREYQNSFICARLLKHGQ